MEPMFDKDSFTDEITGASEANSAVVYLSHNERNFRKGLIDEGLTYDQIEAEVATVWGNLLKACKRVGFSNHVTEARAKLYE
jgi:translation elongation factor EF-1alpha